MCRIDVNLRPILSGEITIMPEFTHSGEAKKQYVKQMFEDISHRYDLFNHLSSFGIDIFWRKKLVN